MGPTGNGGGLSAQSRVQPTSVKPLEPQDNTGMAADKSDANWHLISNYTCVKIPKVIYWCYKLHRLG